MFVNKIINAAQKVNFKSVQHTVNKAGKTVELFGYPYDEKTEIAEIEFARVKKDEKYNIIVDENTKQVLTLKPEGIEVDTETLLDLDKNEGYVYTIRIRDKNNPEIIKWEGADTGVKLKSLGNGKTKFRNGDGRYWQDVRDKDNNILYSYQTTKYADMVNNDGNPNSAYKYTYVTTNGTTPMSNGAGYLVMADSLMPEAKFRSFDDPNTGEVYFDEKSKIDPNTPRTFSNIFGGNIAGLIAIIPYLVKNNCKMMFSLPIANGDDVTSHSYWNKNNNQIATRMGTLANYSELIRQTYRNGIQFVNDGTYTSEGLEGIHFQYALRWAQKNPQTYYWFRMNGLKHSNLGFGVIPENAKNLSHRVVNAPFNYEKQSNGTYKKVPNSNYNPNKETLFQIYDASQVSEAQKNALDKQIRVYENLTSGNPMDINTHDDTLIAYAFQINPNEYQDRINAINELIKSGKNIDLYKEDGTILAGQFSNFKIDRKTEGGFVAWDANTDMVKMNCAISPYDLKNLKSIKDRAERYHEQQMIERGTYEVQDLHIQSGKYWTRIADNVQRMYTAKALGKLTSAEDIKKLSENKILPEKGDITQEEIDNIISGKYFSRRPKGLLSKDDLTIRELMSLPLDALEFGENTAGVLSTSYFSNRATTEDTVGKTRFELLKANNPHLLGEYAGVYNKVNSMIMNEVKDFAYKVIDKVNETSEEKLLDKDGNYTEYGEYIIESVAWDIERYAFLKSLAGENFRAKVLNNGDLEYDTEKIKENTTLKALGINASTPKEEAEILQKMMKNGLKQLSDSDIETVAKSIQKRTENTNLYSYRLAEAKVNKASLGPALRLDAAKDIGDMDAVRNREATFDDVFNGVIQFWKKFVQGIKSENPNAYIVAELTDIPDLMRFTYGQGSCPYDDKTNVNNPIFNGDLDAQTKFFNETGITTEAGYSYLFTNLLVNFAPEFEKGDWKCDTHDAFKDRFDLLMQMRSSDYIRNLYTFIGNHDKTRTIQGLATDMRLFQSPISYGYNEDGSIDFSKESEQRQKVITILSGVMTEKDAPIELRLNADNMDYFRTISPKAAAQAKTLLSSVKEDLKGYLSDEDIKLLSDSIIDLANGNYMIDKNTKSMTRINIPEISTIEGAVNQILNLAETHDFKLEQKTREYLIQAIIKEANELNIKDYMVHGDFSWAAPNAKIGEQNRKYLSEILGYENNGDNYSLYTVQLARLIRDAYNKTKNKEYTNPAMNNALRDFVNKYNRNYVETRTAEPEKFESLEITRNKDSFGVKPFENVMEWVIDQAEFKSGKRFFNRKEIINKVVSSITEPAMQKQAMIMTFLSALAGVPAFFAGDEYGASGYENKSKNTFLPRNIVRRDGVNAEKYEKYTNAAMQSKSDPSLNSLNNGTPYEMDILVNGRNRDEVKKRLAEIQYILDKNNPNSVEKEVLEKERRELSKELAKISYMMYSSNGDAVVSVFYAGNINHSERHDYFAEYGLDNEEKRKDFFEKNRIESINEHNRYVPIQPKTEMDAILLGAGVTLPIGTLFVNANSRDKAKYIVKNIGGKLGIVKEDGGKIVMDGLTAKNGVMLLKKIKNVIFRGNSYNSQYSVVSNPYKMSEIFEEGKKLSVVAK